MALTRRQRGCLWAALGGVVLCVIVVVALVAGAGWLVYQSSSIRQTKPTPEQWQALDAKRDELVREWNGLQGK